MACVNGLRRPGGITLFHANHLSVLLACMVKTPDAALIDFTIYLHWCLGNRLLFLHIRPNEQPAAWQPSRANRYRIS